ncbi:MAG: DUF1385 domain-containing protein [Clostridiaceae bacterium]|nr:DUF1385 domain-containing protein [Clostridiaceae bacterium]
MDKDVAKPNNIEKDVSRNTSSFCPSSKKTTIGGQALIEGLMMFGPTKIAMAIRKPDGSIYVEEVKQDRKIIFFDKVPFIRGSIRFFRQIVTGTGALMKSAEISDIDADKEEPEAVDVEHVAPELSEMKEMGAAPEVSDIFPDQPDQIVDTDQADAARLAAQTPISSDSIKPEKKPKSRLDQFLDRHVNVMIVISAILGILFSVLLFILLPRLIVDIIEGIFNPDRADNIGIAVGMNVIEGILRIVIFLTYLILTSKIKDIARVWMYHGAEHKTIACYEAGEPLTVENIRKHTKAHPRCGTAFMFIVVVISILVFSVASVFLIKWLGVNIWWINLLVRLALVPLVGGISYEVLRLAGRHEDSLVGRMISKPGLWLQRFTTREPDDRMLEVAIAAMQAVLPENAEEDRW